MKYGLIGKSLPHSFSKNIHGFLGNSEYELTEIPPENLEAFFCKKDFCGINVTIPYKEKAMAYCIPDNDAQKIGSVNTIVNKNGTLYGYNTDYFGFCFMAKLAGISFNGKKVVILGSGGTSKTAAFAARDGGAKETVIVSRNGENNYGNIARHSDCGILVNTSPVGMLPGNGQSPVSLQIFKNLSAVIDVVYNPLRTRLLLEAKELGIPAAGGLSMLAAQAVMAHNLFFNIQPNADEDALKIKEIFSKTEKCFSNIVLIGMPGCGKTTIGKKLAALLEMKFTDTDHVVEQLTGRSIPDIIGTNGEQFFRGLEREAIAEAGMQLRQVIATGGGSILLQENRHALAQNGIIIFLDRPLEQLAVSGRPLSVNLPELYRQRLPLYESFCMHKITVSNDLHSNVRKIIAVIEK